MPKHGGAKAGKRRLKKAAVIEKKKQIGKTLRKALSDAGKNSPALKRQRENVRIPAAIKRRLDD